MSGTATKQSPPRRFRGSIRIKFLAISLPIAIVFSTVLIGLSGLQTFRHSRENLDRKLNDLATGQSAILAESVWNLDVEQIELILSSIATDPDFAGAAIFDDNAMLLAGAGSLKNGVRARLVEHLSKEEKRPPSFWDETGGFLRALGLIERPANELVATRNITFLTDAGINEIGEIFISLTAENINADVRFHVVRDGILSFFVILVVGAAAIYANRQTIGIPLRRLFVSIETAREKGRREPVRWLSRDEIGAVVTAYNEMQVHFDDYENELREARDNLEHEVEARTSELKFSNQRLEMILESAGEGIYGLDIEGRTTFVNAAAARMIGWEQDDLIGEPQHNILHHTRPDGTPYPREECPIYAAFHDGAVHQVVDEVFWKKDGTSFPVEYVSTPIWENGEIAGAVVVFRDISRRLQAETALREAKEQAENANRSKSQFLAMMSHEIRTPMNGVHGMLGLLSETELREDQKTLLSTARNSADALLDVINDILDFSKIEAGRLELEVTDFDIETLVNGVTEILTPRITGKDVALSSEIVPGTPLKVRSDPGRLRQILLNLVGNAVRFTERGRVTVRVSAPRNAGAGDMLRFEVTDTGIGIPANKQDSVFAEFTQVDADYSRRFGGTGLGLAISKRLVERLDGEIGFSSDEGLGSTFWFEIPLVLPRDGFVKERRSKKRTPTESREGLGTAPGAQPNAESAERESGGGAYRILVAEDNSTNQLLVKLMLEKLGYRIELVGDGYEAVEAIRTLPYDLVLMDLAMPKVDGIEATEAIRALPEGRGSIPIVAMTANAMQGDRERCLAAGMDDFISKPIDKEMLLATVRKWLGAVSPRPPASPRRKSPETEIFDRTAVEQLAADVDASVVPELIRSFLSDVQTRLGRISDAVECGDMDVLLADSHALCSSAASFGAMDMYRYAEAVERACHDDDKMQALELGRCLLGTGEPTLDALNDYLRDTG